LLERTREDKAVKRVSKREREREREKEEGGGRKIGPEGKGPER